jgi:hypothetical protein
MSSEQMLYFHRNGFDAEHDIDGSTLRLPLARVTPLYSPFHYFVEAQPDARMRDIILYSVYLASLTDEIVKYKIDGNLSGVNINAITNTIEPSDQEQAEIGRRLEVIGGTEALTTEQLIYIGAVANIHVDTFRRMYHYDDTPVLS